MNHHDFLVYFGATLLGLIGVTGLIKTLTGTAPNRKTSASSGYGSSTYGGMN